MLMNTEEVSFAPTTENDEHHLFIEDDGIMEQKRKGV